MAALISVLVEQPAPPIDIVVENIVQNIEVTVANVVGNSGSGNRSMVYFTPAEGVSNFEVEDLDGFEVDMAFRSGLHKRVTATTTTNTLYLQIVGNTVTLPTGDITGENEEFAFKIK